MVGLSGRVRCQSTEGITQNLTSATTRLHALLQRPAAMIALRPRELHVAVELKNIIAARRRQRHEAAT